MNERTKLALKFEAVLISICLALVALWLLCSCGTTKYIPVTSEHTEHHWHTDTVFQRDSVVKESLTTVMQLDSAEMARYGIRLQKAERAWLIQTDRLQRELSELKESKSDTVIKRDSVPYPVEVIKEVPAELSWWQKTRIIIGTFVLGLLAVVAVYRFGKWHLNKIKP